MPRLAAAALIGCVAAAAWPGALRAGTTPPLRLKIAFTADVGGYLEPCG